MLKYFLISALCVFSIIANAKNRPNIDSLKIVLKETNNDTNFIEIAFALGSELAFLEPDSSISFLEMGIERSIKIKNRKRESEFYHNMGIANHYLGKREEARKWYEKSLQIKEELFDTSGMANCYLSIGVTYVVVGNYPKTIEYYEKALLLKERMKDSLGIANCLMNLGSVHSRMKNYNTGIELNKQAMNIYYTAHDSMRFANAMINIGIAFQLMNEYDSALYYHNNALVINRSINYSRGIAIGLNNLSLIYKNLKKYDYTLELLQESYEIDKKNNDKGGMAITLSNIGEAYMYLGDFKKAIINAQNGLDLAREEQSLEYITNASKVLFLSYSALKDFEKAFYYQSIYISNNDSLYSENNSRILNEMETKYQSEKKEMQITVLEKDQKLKDAEINLKEQENKKQRIMLLTAILIIVFVIILAIVIFRQFKQKKKANILLEFQNNEIKLKSEEIASQRDEIEVQRDMLEETLTELTETQSQLVESEKMAALGNLVAGVAHEINTPVGIGITASSSLVEDTKIFAQIYKSGKMDRSHLEEFLENTFQTSRLILRNLDRTGELVKSFKQVSIDQMTDQKRNFKLKEYIEDTLLSLKPILKKKSVVFTVDCDDALEIDSYPGLLAQIITNFVTNTLTHGFKDRDSGSIAIKAGLEENKIILLYTDDGSGIATEDLPKIFDPFFTSDKQLGTGLGLNIVFNLVNQKLVGKIACTSEPGKGVEFQIIFPI